MRVRCPPLAGAPLAILLLLVAPSFAAMPDVADTTCGSIAQDMTRGDFRGVVRSGRPHWQRLVESGPPREMVRLTLQLASAYQALGENLTAIELLNLAMAAVAGDDGQEFMAGLTAKLGEAYLLSGDYVRADGLLSEALGSARELNLSAVMVVALNAQGNLRVLRHEYAAALASFREGLALGEQCERAPTLGSPPESIMIARIHANAGRAAMLAGRVEEAEESLAEARKRHEVLADSHAKAIALINIAKSYQGLALHRPEQARSYAVVALDLYEKATLSARAVGDLTALSYALGYAGQVHEQNHDEALALARTELAESAATVAGAPEALYLWQGQEARLLARSGRPLEAINAYRRAVATLQTMRGEFDGECKEFNQWATTENRAPIYLGLAELLLQQQERTAEVKAQQALLVEVVATLESMKSTELRSYFQNTCINEQRLGFAERQGVPAKSAIIYLLPLPKRLEMILSLPKGLMRFTVPVAAETLTRLTREFRHHLENRTSREYLVSSQELYSLLVSPYRREAASQGVDTLVFVPEGALRTVPFAALHDGRDFLIERWAVATIPTLGLTDLAQEEQPHPKLLLAGITSANQGFAPLPHVADELQGLHLLYGGDLLMNKGFTTLSLRTAIERTPYTMVHIATHGEFKAESRDTFLVAWDARIDMDLLHETLRPGRYRKRPIDLLTLSACQTAADSERAALGLAGLSLQAGVRSALATLWYVDDGASSGLMSEFYRNLTDPAYSKARALQQAQKSLLAGNRYHHPAYWSPFLLVGNWK